MWSDCTLLAAAKWQRPPAGLAMNANPAAQSSAAVFTMVSSTGCRSDGDRLMTLSTSPSPSDTRATRAALGSRLHLAGESRALDGNGRLVGEGPEKIHLSVRKGPWTRPRNRDRTNRSALVQYRYSYQAAVVHGGCDIAEGIGRVRVNVRDLHNGAAENGASSCAAVVRPPGRDISRGLDRFGWQSMMGDHVKEFPIEQKDVGQTGMAQPRGVPRNRLESRLNSAGDRAMRRKISAVALCCSSESARRLVSSSTRLLLGDALPRPSSKALIRGEEFKPRGIGGSYPSAHKP